MLSFVHSRITTSTERAVSAGHVVQAEGLLLKSVVDNGHSGVRPATTTDKGPFAGISVNAVTFQPSMAHVEDFVVDATNKLLLSYVPIADTISAYKVDLATGKETALSAPSVAGQVATISGADAGSTVRVKYTFSPTMVQQMAYQGNIIPGGPAGQYVGQVGVITQGDVYTDQWDTADDWSLAVGVKAGKDGLFKAVTAGNEQDAIRGVEIIALPTTNEAFLGLHINLPA